MFRFQHSTFTLFITIATFLLVNSCGYHDPPLSYAYNSGLYVTWVFVEEEAECNQGGTYTVNNSGQNIELQIIRENNYEYSVNGEITQSGTFIFWNEDISFTPPIFPNDIGVNSTYLFLGPTLYITTTERLNSNSNETCRVKRTYRRKR